jgi:ribonuclease P protein component
LSLPKINRLPRRDFDLVYRQSRRYFGKYFNLRVLFENVDAVAGKPYPPQFGVVAGKKVDKRAVGRNLVKRRARAAIRSLLPICKGGCRTIVLARSDVATCEYDEILRELEELLRAAEVIG